MKRPPKSVMAIALGVALLGVGAVIGSGAADGIGDMNPCVIYTTNITADGQYEGSNCMQRRQEVHGHFLRFVK